MKVSQMREYLKGRFSPQFNAKLDKMPDDQVMAIYYRTINKKEK
jgi:hypothetical protein